MLTQLSENLRLLIAEVDKQVRDTAECLKKGDDAIISKIHMRDDYIDNMKGIIHNRAFRLMMEHPDMSKPQIDTVRAIGIATDNLENIADFCTHIADQTHFLSRLEFLDAFEIPLYFEEILSALPLLETAILKKDSSIAFRICHTEFRLDTLYKRHFDQILQRLEGQGQTHDLITSLFIIRYLERAGDALLNIGEAAISCILGEKFKIHQVSALEHVALQFAQEESGHPTAEGIDDFPETNIQNLEYASLAETRSGCRIGRIRNPARRGAGNWALYKEGPISKIAQERVNLERWNSLVPGLVPRILSYHEQDEHAHMLLEYLHGQTFQDILLNDSESRIFHAVDAICLLLGNLWERTLEKTPIHSRFMEQLQARLPDILRIHPTFNTPDLGIGSLVIPSFTSRIANLSRLEKEIVIPFSVFIHGDFNNDNLIIEPSEQTVRFIDVNRSRQGDYLQDITVFLLSNFRLPVFEPTLRSRITEVNRRMFSFAKQFAREHDDPSFETRCALGLVRSFLTSTRFVAAESFAEEMYRRAVYLTELLGNSDKTFHFQEEILE